MNKDSLSTFVRSKLFAGIVTGVGITLIAVFLFEAGVAVGYHEADYSSRFGENYTRTFGGDSMGLGLPDEHAPTPDGAMGKIISVSSSTMIIESPQKPEQKVLIESDTVIRNRENTVTASALSIGSTVVVIGSPNDQGEIEAKLIRIVPSSTEMSSTTGMTASQP